MTNEILPKLKALADLDHLIQVAKAEIARTNSKLKDLDISSASLTSDYQDKLEKITSAKKSYEQQQQELIDQEQALGARRRALASLPAKMQFKAKLDIEHVEKLLVKSRLEFSAKPIIDYEKQLEELKTATRTRALDLIKLKEEAELIQAKAKDRIVSYQEDKAKLLPDIPADAMKMYQIATNKYPANPLSELLETLCTACNMELGRQTQELVYGGEKLVSCRSCSRILYRKLT